MVAVVTDEDAYLLFWFTWQVEIIQEDAVFHGLVLTLNLLFSFSQLNNICNTIASYDCEVLP